MKKPHHKNFKYLQGEAADLNEIFSCYERKNLPHRDQILCNITNVCVNSATFRSNQYCHANTPLSSQYK